YCFGQMQDEKAVDVLLSVLKNEEQEPMVRHEAAEALGAIGSDVALSYLEKYKNDPVIEVAETCELALDRINWLKHNEHEKDKLSKNPYNSVDPAPPAFSNNIDVLKSILFDENISLFDRYRAMFSLRNIKSDDAVVALSHALKVGSALFKHEVAFVLGQIQHTKSVPYLIETLENCEE
nr:nero [Cucujiformia]